ncbi:unnamed protein product [Ostreobium quekettii]|uniref:F-box domain-containing protein n=1 Tax=Ostreobium quekettii TaxID=121088 RepID=A0A8S1IS47_9CHLO|nr:unnamed protein product [Ostreobium quekettii]|eukprot:evm.model.scf_883.4 EVM.evm.TU.scf_883.4   scf_883:50068-52830(+)
MENRAPQVMSGAPDIASGPPLKFKRPKCFGDLPKDCLAKVLFLLDCHSYVNAIVSCKAILEASRLRESVNQEVAFLQASSNFLMSARRLISDGSPAERWRATYTVAERVKALQDELGRRATDMRVRLREEALRAEAATCLCGFDLPRSGLWDRLFSLDGTWTFHSETYQDDGEGIQYCSRIESTDRRSNTSRRVKIELRPRWGDAPGYVLHMELHQGKIVAAPSGELMYEDDHRGDEDGWGADFDDYLSADDEEGNVVEGNSGGVIFKVFPKEAFQKDGRAAFAGMEWPGRRRPLGDAGGRHGYSEVQSGELFTRWAAAVIRSHPARWGD